MAQKVSSVFCYVLMPQEAYAWIVLGVMIMFFRPIKPSDLADERPRALIPNSDPCPRIWNASLAISGRIHAILMP